MLTASPNANSSPTSQFDGWSANCLATPPSPQLLAIQPTAGMPNYCYLTVANNNTVGAIFDQTAPANP
jgi:hypothetical protein